MYDPEFAARHRGSPRDFTRERKLGFARTVLFLMNFLKHALQYELDAFFAELAGGEVPSREVTKSAFSQARRKLNPEAFVELNDLAVAHFYAKAPGVRRWRDYRLLAVDGTTLRLPDTADVRREFEESPDEVPRARLVELYDVLNGVMLGAECSPLYMGERFHAERLVERCVPGDLVLYDRGFPGFYLMALHRKLGADFCMRVTTTQFTQTAAFARSGLSEQWVEIAPSGKVRSECRRDDLDASPLPVRLVRVDLPSGEVEVLMTSLGDAIPIAEFAALYAQRRGIEEAYKAQKCRVELETFSGKTALAVRQDIHANLLGANLAALCAAVTQDTVETRTSGRVHRYRVNHALAIAKMKRHLVRLLHALDHKQMQVLLWLDWIAQDVEPLRPDRKAPRRNRMRVPQAIGSHTRCP